MRIAVLLLWLSFLVSDTAAQSVFKPISPLKIPLKLAGTFGELRGNHFHSGIDLKTNGVEGQEVVAAEDGFISRIKISATGFGNALYINHPQGYTTVYAHLSTFSTRLTALMDSIQRSAEQYEAEFFPDSTQFPVKKGEIIGLSGNSGGSEGPHLHFEIRDRISEEPLNPLNFGLPVSDTISPTILRIIPYFFDGRNWTRFPQLPDTDTIYCNRDTMGLGVYAIDPDSSSRLGIYRADLLLDDSLIFSFSMDRFNFNETRLVNAHIDYPYWNDSKERIHRLHKLMNDDFSQFRNSGTGKIPLPQEREYALTVILSDNKGNFTTRNVVVVRTFVDSTMIGNVNRTIPVFGDSAFEFKSSSMSITGEKGSFYQDENLIPVSIKRPSKAEYFTAPAGFYNPEIAVAKPIAYRLHIPSKLKHIPSEKLIYLETDTLGKIKGAGRVSVKNDSAEVRLRKATLIALGSDEEAPEIVKYKIANDTITGNPLLKIKASDSLTGIVSTRVMQDGQWIPSYYESKTGEVIARLHATFPTKVSIAITDACQNTILLETGL